VACPGQAQPVGDGALDQVGPPVKIGGAGQNPGVFLRHGGIGEMARGLGQCANQGFGFLAPGVQRRLAHGQHLFHAASPDLRRGQHDRPAPRSTATLFHGSPTQMPSTSPASSASALNGGAPR
jgi:hypothetical protein